MGPKQPMPRWFAFPGAYIALGVILFASAWLAGFWYAPDKLVRVEQVTSHAKLGSPGQVRDSMSVEAQPVDCAQLNIPAELRCEAFEQDTMTVILVSAP